MNKIIIQLLVFVNTLFVFAQTPRLIDTNSVKIEMLFPGVKSKALILSYADGSIHDRKLVALMNKYQLIGTFHLNSNKLGTDTHFNYLNKEEVKKIFAKHEVLAADINSAYMKTSSI